MKSAEMIGKTLRQVLESLYEKPAEQITVENEPLEWYASNLDETVTEVWESTEGSRDARSLAIVTRNLVWLDAPTQAHVCAAEEWRDLYPGAWERLAPLARYGVTPATHPLDFCDPDPSTNPTKPKPHYLVFDPQEGTLKIDWDYSTSGTPMDVHHGIVLRYSIPPRVNAVELTEAINSGEFDALLDTIQQGHTVSWNGHNHKGYLSAEAQDAENDLISKLEAYEDDSLGGLWDAGDWLQDTRHELGITAASTDAELKALAAKLEAEALNENAKLYGTEEYLQSIRQEIIDAAEDKD